VWAISVQQPFAFFIININKDVENRTWQPKGIKAGDRLAIVASKKWHEYYCSGGVVYWKGISNILRQNNRDPNRVIRPIDFMLGGLIGTVLFNGVTKTSNSKWAIEGQCHWLLSDPQPLPFRPVKGQLGLYQIDLT